MQLSCKRGFWKISHAVVHRPGLAATRWNWGECWFSCEAKRSDVPCGLRCRHRFQFFDLVGNLFGDVVDFDVVAAVQGPVELPEGVH